MILVTLDYSSRQEFDEKRHIIINGFKNTSSTMKV